MKPSGNVSAHGWRVFTRGPHVALLALVVAGCSGGDDAPSGTAPVITSVKVTPASLTVGGAQTVTGEFEFEDAEGDLSQFSLSVKIGAQSSTTPKGAIQNVAGQKAGKGIFAASLVAPQAGDVDLALTIYDAAGNASSPYSTVLTAK